jgi:hypothetical protein
VLSHCGTVVLGSLGLIDLVLDDFSKNFDAVGRKGEDFDAIDIVNPQQWATSGAIRVNTTMTNSTFGDGDLKLRSIPSPVVCMLVAELLSLGRWTKSDKKAMSRMP